MTEQNDEAAFLKKRLTEIDNHRHRVLTENHRLGLVIDEYRNQMAGQFVGARDLRDWFAGQALVGMMQAMRPYSNDFERSARDAYIQADAMMAERMKGASLPPSQEPKS